MAPIWILFIVIALAGWIVQGTLQSRFKKYSKIPIRNGMTGKEVAEKMLHENGIHDVQVISVRGKLTDHYNPLNKTINLSEPVYGSHSVAAAAWRHTKRGMPYNTRGLRSLEDAIGLGTGDLLHVQVGDVGDLGGNSYDSNLPDAALDWDSHVCHDHVI